MARVALAAVRGGGDYSADYRGQLAELAREHGAAVFDGRGWLSDDHIGDGHHATAAGADAFLLKTCSRAELYATIDHVLRHDDPLARLVADEHPTSPVTAAGSGAVSSVPPTETLATVPAGAATLR